MSEPTVDVLAELSAVIGGMEQPVRKRRVLRARLIDVHAAVAELIEREAKLRAALTLAVEKADRIGGDMKYSDFAHPGHPNGECAWYLAAKLALVTGEGS